MVFNHKQSENLLKNGSITGRGKALAGGTALANGGVGKVTADKSSSSSDSSSSKDKSKSNSSDKTVKTALEKYQNWLSKFFDWIEVKLERQTTKINKYISNAEKYLDSNNYKKSIKIAQICIDANIIFQMFSQINDITVINLLRYFTDQHIRRKILIHLLIAVLIMINCCFSQISSPTVFEIHFAPFIKSQNLLT